MPKPIIHDLEEGTGDNDPGWGYICFSQEWDRDDYRNCAENMKVIPVQPVVVKGA